MPYRSSAAALALLILSLPAAAQSSWSWAHRLELRADYRWSDHEKFPLRFPFPPEFLPPGETQGFLETPDSGHHVELNVADLQLDLRHGTMFHARIKAHAEARHRRNPTSSDRQADIDELFLRLGPAPEFLERPAGTSVFVQAGKFPKLERQPVRLLESYGLATTAFNRFEDIQVVVGGTAGRSLYWRLIAANGNPVFMRDPNALAGDNGTPELREPFPTPVFKSGFPILYNAEAEGLALDLDGLQFGQAAGWRWQRDDQSVGFDLILFHYERGMDDEVNLTGTFYGGDLDLLDGPTGEGLPVSSDRKEEYGGRFYGEWDRATLIAQFTKQNLAGLQREGWEAEAGYTLPFAVGPIQSMQPAVRVSGLTNRFRGPATFVAPSFWWNWTKIDAGLRVTLPRNVDVTLEYTKHNVGTARNLDLREALVTVRWRT